MGYSVRGVKVGESPAWLKEALNAIGMRPLNNVVDATNYVLHELGQPLHAFDADKIAGSEIIVRAAREGEIITTLDDKERALEPFMTVIADTEKPLVIAGVMGSVDAEVDAGTTNIFLESAWFDPAMTRRTSRHLGLSTDSSYRFERGVDPLAQGAAAERCLQLILEIAGGELVSTPLVSGEPKYTKTQVELKPSFVRERFGFEVADSVIAESLRALECAVVEKEDDLFEVGIPSWRGDLYRPVDLVEEVIRIYGCDQIPEGEVKAHGLVAEDHPIPVFLRKASERLVGKGFQETMHYSLRKSDELAEWFPAEPATALALQNPLASDASHLRASLLPGLLDCVQLNQARLNNPQRLFETGRVFRSLNGKTIELVSVAFVIVRSSEAQWMKREDADFYTASSIIGELGTLAGLKADSAAFETLTEDPIWQDGQAAIWGDLRRGYEARFGLLSPRLTRAWNIEGLLVAGTFFFSPKFLQKARKRKGYTPFSAFPPASRDLALLVDATEASGSVRKKLEKLGASTTPKGFDLEAVSVFDVYLGKGLPEGKKSIGFNLSYRAADRTLKDKEVNKAFEALQVAIKEKTAYSIRS
jgi:phenylalanyl-tRNA synthetase beta chain